jgi:hypothetical protein
MIGTCDRERCPDLKRTTNFLPPVCLHNDGTFCASGDALVRSARARDCTAPRYCCITVTDRIYEVAKQLKTF